MRHLLAAVLCAVTGAVAGAGAATVEGGLDRELRELGLDPATIVVPVRVDEEMRLWVRERVPESGDARKRLRSLLGALVGPEGLGIRYSPDAHGTAQEVFSSGHANCLAFTNLFIALAREVGIDAYYLEVRRQPRYEQEGDLVVLWEHVTAAYGRPDERLVLEFALGPPLESTAGRRLSDMTALAMFYSNRGAEALRAGEHERARHWLETAVRLDPEWAPGWLNLGVARRRTSDLDGAEEAYRAAVGADPEYLQAYHNLAALLRLRGERNAAREILRLLDRRDNRDPFIYLALGDASLEAKRLDEARRFYRRALWLGPEQPEPRAALGMVAVSEGRPELARRWLRRAERLGAGSSRVARLQRLLEAAGG